MTSPQSVKKRSDSSQTQRVAGRCWRGLLRLWAGPWTLLGLTLALAMRLGGASWRWRQGVLEATGGRLAAGCLRLGGPEALTLGHVVLAVNERRLSHWRAHERVHVGQYERWGLLFVPAYLLESAWQWGCGRSAYRDNRFERQARHIADRSLMA